MADKTKRLGEFLKDHRKIFITVLILILLGLAVSAGTAYLDRYFHEQVGPLGELSWGLTLLLKVLDHVALAFFSVAILGVIVELPHMKEYFQKRIENTIISRSFIQQLSDSEKERLQEQALEAFFGVDELDQEGGFYKFYVKKIRRHINDPFRKDTTFETVIERSAKPGLFTVSDTISFTCNKGGKRILPTIEWTTEWDEIEGILQLEITAERPDQSGNPDLYSFDSATNSCHEALINNPDGWGYTLSLDKYESCDGLRITVKVVYEVSNERALSWTMPYLSKGFSGAIHFPSDLQIYVDRFGIDADAVPKDKANLPTDARGFSVCEISHKDWLLPHNGFCFSFRQKPAATALSTSAQTSVVTAPPPQTLAPAGEQLTSTRESDPAS